MHVAFGRVRRKTAPARGEVQTSYIHISRSVSEIHGNLHTETARCLLFSEHLPRYNLPHEYVCKGSSYNARVVSLFLENSDPLSAAQCPKSSILEVPVYRR